MPARRLLCVAVLLFAASSPAVAQITWNFTYSDAAGSGFNDNTIDPGQTQSRSALRKGTLVAATQYLNNFLDGRGTIALNLDPSANSTATPVLASFGAGQVAGITGSFQNGGLYQGGRANQLPFSGVAGSGEFNFGYSWNYFGQAGAPSGSAIDMLTVAIHEITHGLGFAAFTNSAGQGLAGQPVGSPDIYSGYARFMQRGNGPLATSGLYNTNIGSGGYGSFTGPVSTLTNGSTNTTTGLFFGGEYTREVYGGASRLYAPATFSGGSSLSHVDDTVAVMNPSVSFNTLKRLQAYEVAMLLDIGWNVYNWNGTGGNWLDGVSNLSQSRWRTDSGIVYNGAANGNQTFNINATPGQAPILPVSGQTTANIVLNFANSGSSSYVSTNNVGSVRLSRLNLNSTSTGTTEITGGTLNFGLNLDGSPSVLVPKIVQKGSSAVTISSAIQTNTVSTFNVVVNSQTLATHAGHNGITVEGTGSGAVTLSGVVSGDGGITKGGTFNLIYANTNPNTYTGTTTVNAGALYVNGTLSSTANGVTVNGGTLGGTGTINRAITVNSGGTLEGGTNTTIGTLGVKAATTVMSGGNLRAEVGAGTSSDKLDMTGGSHALDLKNGSLVALSASGFARTTTTYTLADLDSNTAALLKVDGANVNADTTITTFTSTGANAGSSANSVGNIDFTLANFTAGNVLAGDTFTLRRSLGGDLVVVFTPVPEPAGMLLVCGLVTAGVVAWRRRKK